VTRIRHTTQCCRWNAGGQLATPLGECRLTLSHVAHER
jgi:hypothetical protein